jgi:hypothetical protein
MTAASTAWLAITLLISAMALIVVWSRRQTLYRSLAVATALLSAPAAALSLASTLGWAVPVVPMLTAPGGDFLVLGAKIVQGEGIFVLLDIGSGEPRHYRLPWDQKLADKLQDILDDPNKGGVMLKIPYEPSLDTNAAQFWPLPQPKALPDKPPQKPAPHFDA